MKKYVQKNIFPIFIEFIFIISCFIVPKEYFIYTNFLFYMVLLLYFIVRREFSFSEWKNNIRNGKRFWVPVILTSLGFIIAFILTTTLENVFPNWDSGMIRLRINTWIQLIIFTLSTILLPPITEELFYRKSLIDFRNKKFLILTTILSMFLYGLEHSLSIWGIFLTMIWAIPLSISYIKTKNVYVPMTAHFLVNLIGNGSNVIFSIIYML